MKLLIDEDLSPTVANRLRVEDGIDAIHVRDRGKLGEPDQRLLEYAYEEDRILVTCNVGDFRRLASSREIHPGIVLLLDGGLLRDEQVATVRKATEMIEAECAAGKDMVNRVLRISFEGAAEFENLPGDPADE